MSNSGPLLEEQEVDKEIEAFEMVQTYGAVRTAYAESEPGPSSGSEQSALLGGERDTTVKKVAQRDGHATLTSCISNLANTIMGTGACLLNHSLSFSVSFPYFNLCRHAYVSVGGCFTKYRGA